MTGLPEPAAGPPMGDELGDAWERYDSLLRRAGELERLADRLAAVCPDPVLVAEFKAWKSG